jgi:hypothetical protein
MAGNAKLLSCVCGPRGWATEDPRALPRPLPPPSGAGVFPPEKDTNLHVNREAAAELLAVSPRSVASARKVLEHGQPELIAAVERGEIAVSMAAEQALGFKRSLRSERFYQRSLSGSSPVIP